MLFNWLYFKNLFKHLNETFTPFFAVNINKQTNKLFCLKFASFDVQKLRGGELQIFSALSLNNFQINLNKLKVFGKSFYLLYLCRILKL